MRKFLFTASFVITSLILFSGCSSIFNTGGSNLQSSILTAGKLSPQKIKTTDIPSNWTVFENTNLLGLKFSYPSSWGRAEYKANADGLTGNVTFSKSNYNVYASSPDYDWNDEKMWRYPAFTAIACNQDRTDTICEMITLQNGSLMGRDTRFSYNNEGGRGGIEQVLYFLNSKTGYRFSLFSREFGQYVDGTLSERLDVLEQFRKGKMNPEWSKEIEDLGIILQSIELL